LTPSVYRAWLARSFPFPVSQLGACFAQLFEHRIEETGVRAMKYDAAAGRCGRREKGSGFDAVGHDAVLRPCSRATPSIAITSVPAPLIRAPIAERHWARSITSGSRAAFSSVVVPSLDRRHHEVLGAREVTRSIRMRAPFNRLAFAEM